MMLKELWPGWETVEAIGSGGFSKVYKIRKKDSGDTEEYYAALKIISIPQSPEEYETYALEGFDEDTITGIFTSQVKRIVEEFRLMAQFKGNSNIVSYEDHMIVPHADGKGWDILIRMELLEAMPRYISHTAMGTEEVVKLGVDICRALELCQKQNIIHRDIKPQNIFVNKFGDYKLGDFGIAKSMDHTTHATKTGTYSYMAPEVYRGEAYGATIDLYSLGLVLYWLLNEKRTPFLPLPPAAPTAAQLNESQARRLSGEALPAPKNGSERLKAIVLKACAANAADRYASATAMRKELERELFAIMDAKEEEAAIAPASPAEVAVDDATVLPATEEKTESLIFAAPLSPAPTPAEASVEADERTEAMPFAAFAGGAEAAEEPASEATVGLFGANGATVGLFGERTEPAPAKSADPAPTEPAPAPASTPAPTPASPVQPKQSSAGKWIAIIGGAVLALIVVLLLLLRGCGGGAGNETETTTDGAGGVAVPDVTTTVSPSTTTAADPVTTTVSPSTTATADPVTTTVSPSTTATADPVTTPSLTTHELKLEYGNWSEWSTEKPATSADRLIESNTQYRYRTGKLVESNDASYPGGVLVNQSVIGIEYGIWSGWGTTSVTQSTTLDVETKKQYRSREIVITQEWGAWSAWSEWDTKKPAAVLANVEQEIQERIAYEYSLKQYRCETCGKIYTDIDYMFYVHAHNHGATENTLAIIHEFISENGSNLSVEQLFQLIDPDASIEYNVVRVTIESKTLLTGFMPPDHDYEWSLHTIELDGEIWGSDTGAPDRIVTQYSYRTRQSKDVKSYSAWSAYGDTKITADSDTQVEERTLYRSRSITEKYLYQYKVWGAWSEWSFDKPASSSNVETEECTVYRYADPIQ